MEIKQILPIYNQTKIKNKKDNKTKQNLFLLSIKASLNLQVKISIKNYDL